MLQHHTSLRGKLYADACKRSQHWQRWLHSKCETSNCNGSVDGWMNGRKKTYHIKIKGVWGRVWMSVPSFGIRPHGCILCTCVRVYAAFALWIEMSFTFGVFTYWNHCIWDTYTYKYLPRLAYFIRESLKNEKKKTFTASSSQSICTSLRSQSHILFVPFGVHFMFRSFYRILNGLHWRFSMLSL